MNFDKEKEMEQLSMYLSIGLVISMLYTGAIWLLAATRKVRMDSSIIAYTLILWGSLYGFTLLSAVDRDVLYNIFKAGFIMICLSQSIPMTVAFIRSIHRGNQ